MSLKSFITESIGILRSNSGPECAMAVDQIEQSVTKEFARLERRAKDWANEKAMDPRHPHLESPYCDECGNQIYLLGTGEEKRIGRHAHDCDAAIILGLERESGAI